MQKKRFYVVECLREEGLRCVRVIRTLNTNETLSSAFAFLRGYVAKSKEGWVQSSAVWQRGDWHHVLAVVDDNDYICKPM